MMHCTKEYQTDIEKDDTMWSYLLCRNLLLNKKARYKALVVVQSSSHVWLFVTPWTSARQVFLSLTISEVCPSSCSLHEWWHPAIASSDALFSFCPQPFPASGTFPMSQLFTLDDQNTEVSASALVLPVSIQGWFPFRLTGLVSLMSKEISRCSKASIFHWSAFFMVQLSQLYVTTGKTIALTIWTYLCQQSNVSAFQHTV